MGLSISELITHIRRDIGIAESKTHGTHTPTGCKHCGCFLSLKREDPTGYHIKRSNGTIDYVIVYHGKIYCQACHKFQRDEQQVV